MDSLHHADPEPEQDTLDEDVLIVGLAYAGHHDAEDEYHCSWYHEDARTVCVEYMSHKAALM